MRAAVLRGARDLAVEERPLPRPGPREVLVQVRAVGVCGSDVHYFEHGRIGANVVRGPHVLGHEAAGVVIDHGTDARRHRTGVRVSIEPGVPCFTCRLCRRGRPNLCPDVRFLGTPPVDGALCEYLHVHEDFAHPVPDDLSEEAAALLEPLSVALWSVRKARVSPGDRVLVTGAGPVGLLVAQVARVYGAAEVVVTDIRPERLVVAANLGATATLAGGGNGGAGLAEHGLEVDVLVECTGVPSAAADAIRTVGRAGRVVLVGMGADTVPIPLDHVQRREIEVLGSFRYADTWPTAIGLASSGRVELDRLVTHRFGLDDTRSALTAVTGDATVLKPVVLPGE